MAILQLIGALILAALCLVPFVAAGAFAWYFGGWPTLVLLLGVLAIGGAIASLFLRRAPAPNALQALTADPDDGAPADATGTGRSPA